MPKPLHRYLFVALLLLLFLSRSISQNENPSAYRSLLAGYKAATQRYDEATALSDADGAEEKESALNREALQRFQSLEEKLPHEPLYDSMRFFTSFRIGELQHYFEHFEEALAGYTKAIDIQKKSQLPDSLLFRPYLYSGIIYYNKNKYDSATILFNHAEKVQASYKYAIQESERLYNTFGALYYEKGDYLQARNYFSKAMETLSPAHPYYRALHLNYQVNLAQIYFKLEEYGKADAIYGQLLAQHPANAGDIYHNLGLINLYLGAPAKALEYFRMVSDRSSNKVIWLYRNIGVAFMDLGQADSARLYFDKAAAAHRAFGDNTDHNAYGQTLKSEGDLLVKEGRPWEALQHYQQSIHQFYPAYIDTLVNLNPRVFTGAFSYIDLFTALTAKANAWHRLYTGTNGINYGKEELKTYQSAFALLDYVERTYNSDEARLFLEKTNHLVHSKPIDVAYDLYRKTGDHKFLEDLYIFDQQNKASVLAIKAQLIQQRSEKDSSLLARERDIRSTITRLSLRAMHPSDTNEAARINAEIRDNEIRLEPVQERLSGSYTQAIPTVSALQKNILDERTALVSFHLSEEKLTTITITKDSFGCSQQPLPDGFTKNIQVYLNALKNEEDLTAISGSSRMLYSFLLQPVDLKGKERLIIIPDEELNYLSFESLMDNNGEYLIKKYNFQYQYSTALLKREAIDFRDHQTLSFAPFAGSGFGDSLQELPNSLKEISGLSGRRQINGAATKQSFLRQLQDYPVIHLATHAIINETDDNLSYISFYPGRDRDSFLLYTKEVYNLPLEKTKLIILSACETSGGNLAKGEGVMSFSRAFAYAGCSNIITSLWNASDFSTAWLTRRIHFYLDKNYAIDGAVRQAKLDYLSDGSISPRLKHPFYWSHLIFVGNVTVPAGEHRIWPVVGLVLLAVVLWMFIKPRRATIDGQVF